ncbi:MAG: biotin--[acetyl-CoA-carboxylase] ligase [Paracoccaceae bacterium]|nr:biotin--[acetyl-CoA-carboxylase] ligase [Paracoccaceae bacterium]
MSTDATSAGWPQGTARIVLAEVDSTLNEAARRFDTLRGPTWVLALHQTAARGRRGRDWRHPAGNFAATLVLPGPLQLATAALRSFVASLALYDAFAAATGRPGSFALKWPNDVLLNGGKVAGMLLETIGPRGDALSIGIGVNLAQAPDAGQVEQGAVRPVSLLSETGAAVSPEEFLDLLAPAYARYEAQFAAYGFAPIRTAWLDRAARLGQQITARLPAEEVTGRFDTVDEQGQLVLSTPQGPRRIAAADVFF